MKTKFLVVSIFTAKDGTTYLSGHFWSDQYNKWLDSKQKDGSFGKSLVKADKAKADKLVDKLSSGLVVELEVSGYNGNFPIWSLV